MLSMLTVTIKEGEGCALEFIFTGKPYSVLKLTTLITMTSLYVLGICTMFCHWWYKREVYFLKEGFTFL